MKSKYFSVRYEWREFICSSANQAKQWKCPINAQFYSAVLMSLCGMNERGFKSGRKLKHWDVRKDPYEYRKHWSRELHALSSPGAIYANKKRFSAHLAEDAESMLDRTSDSVGSPDG